MAYEKIEYDLDGDVAVIRLNDPTTLNAMTRKMGEELLDAVERAAREARAMVICSAGRGFCSGANLSDGGLNPQDSDRDVGIDLEEVFNPLVLQMRVADIPVITAIRGPAAGVGCGIALAGDIIVASETAVFIQAFRHVGLAPDSGLSYLLVRAVGRPRAMEMMLLGEKVTAAKALDWGLINRVYPDEDMDDAVMAMARDFAKGPKSLGIIKRVAWAAADVAFESALANERTGQREAGRTEDFVEGITAFMAKRKPRFSGR